MDKKQGGDGNMAKTIFLVDMNAFFITCEMLRHPELRGKPAAVAGDPKRRTGIILASNYEARAFGVKTTMTINEALKHCRDMLLVPPDHHYYEETSEKVMEFLSHFSPIIEQNSIDEAWLDMTGTEGLFGSPLDAAKKIMEELKENLGLWCSIGIAENKFLAKMASDMKKPLGITWLKKEDIESKLWPLPVGAMYGVGRKTTEELNKMGIRTIRDLSMISAEKLQKKFGKVGFTMHLHANGIDNESLIPRVEDDIKSIGKSVTLPEDLSDFEKAKEILLRLSDEISIRARKRKKKGHTVQITIKYKDFTSITRQASIQETDLPKRIYHAGSDLLAKNWDKKKPVRLLGITLTDFEKKISGEQISIFSMTEDSPLIENEREEKLQDVIDSIRDKFGKNKVSWGNFLPKGEVQSDEAPEKDDAWRK